MTAEHNITFKDTLLYMPCTLKKLPKCMGLEGDLEKGFFPYRFLTLDNAEYVGEISRKELFETDRMSDAEKRDFDEWYNTFALRQYNIKGEYTK